MWCVKRDVRKKVNVFVLLSLCEVSSFLLIFFFSVAVLLHDLGLLLVA